MASIFYYAMGGGLGHLTRGRAFLHTFGLERDATIVSDSPFASDRRVVGEIPVTTTLPEDGQVILDAFPAGLFGEIRNRTVDYVARYVRWERYTMPADPPRIRNAYVLEPLHPQQEAWLRQHAERIIGDIELRDPPPAPQTLLDLPPSYVLVVHSGSDDEREELLAYAREVCGAEGVDDPVVMPDVYPATLIAARAARIFTGGGFNAMRQFGGDHRHRPLPFDRRFDDQYTRIARVRATAKREA